MGAAALDGKNVGRFDVEVDYAASVSGVELRIEGVRVAGGLWPNPAEGTLVRRDVRGSYPRVGKLQPFHRREVVQDESRCDARGFN